MIIIIRCSTFQCIESHFMQYIIRDADAVVLLCVVKSALTKAFNGIELNEMFISIDLVSGVLLF